MNFVSSKMTKRYEVDLYDPVKTYFTEMAYTVYGEVKDCDVVALREEELVIIELKLTINITLLMQAAKRQRITDKVFIAIPKPNYSLRSQKWRDLSYLIRRLELGLILVSFQGDEGKAKIVIEPSSFNRKKSMQLSQKRRNQVIKEIEGRSGDYNVGGSTRTKILSAYQENCIHIACCLVRFGPLSPKALRDIGTGEKTSAILSKNYYGWFERVERGIYVLSDKGEIELKLYEELVNYYDNLI